MVKWLFPVVGLVLGAAALAGVVLLAVDTVAHIMRAPLPLP